MWLGKKSRGVPFLGSPGMFDPPLHLSPIPCPFHPSDYPCFPPSVYLTPPPFVSVLILPSVSVPPFCYSRYFKSDFEKSNVSLLHVNIKTCYGGSPLVSVGGWKIENVKRILWTWSSHCKSQKWRHFTFHFLVLVNVPIIKCLRRITTKKI